MIQHNPLLDYPCCVCVSRQPLVIGTLVWRQTWAGPTKVHQVHQVHQAALSQLSGSQPVCSARAVWRHGAKFLLNASQSVSSAGRAGQRGRKAVCREPQQKNKAALRGEAPGHTAAAGRAELHPAAANKHAHKPTFLIFNLLEARNNPVLGLEPQESPIICFPSGNGALSLNTLVSGFTLVTSAMAPSSPAPFKGDLD